MKQVAMIILSISILLVIILGINFYWFQLRPTRIKRDCSWFQNHSEAIPEVTQAQYNECLDKWNNRPEALIENGIDWNKIGERLGHGCEQPHPAVPAKSWWQSADYNKYLSCLRENGL